MPAAYVDEMQAHAAQQSRGAKLQLPSLPPVHIGLADVV